MTGGRRRARAQDAGRGLCLGLCCVWGTATAGPGTHRPGRLLEVPDGAVEVALSFPNDNLLFGQWRWIARDGDDFGWTHGSRATVRVGWPRVPGRWVAVEAASDLYTRRLGRDRDPLDGSVRTAQAFVNDNRLLVALGEGGEAGVVWDVRLGWHQRDAASGRRPLQASWQQAVAHDLIRAIAPLQATEPSYVPTEDRAQDGLMAAGTVGWQLEGLDARRGLRGRLTGRVGALVSTLSRASRGLGSLEGFGWWSRRPSGVAVGLGTTLDLAVHADGLRGVVTPALRVGDRRVDARVALLVPFGAGLPHVDHDLASRWSGRWEPLFDVGLAVRVPTRRRGSGG